MLSPLLVGITDRGWAPLTMATVDDCPAWLDGHTIADFTPLAALMQWAMMALFDN